MMSRRLLSRDPVTGVESYFTYHDDRDAFSIETVQNVDDVLDENKRDYNDAQTGWKGDMHKVASIPLSLYWELKMQGIIDDQTALKRWLNDPDNKYFRTKPGRV
jgi:hypothetical protein